MWYAKLCALLYPSLFLSLSLKRVQQIMPNNEMKRTCLRYSHSCSRIHYLCVCDWQIIIHTWLRHGGEFPSSSKRRMCDVLHMCLHMAFIVMDPNGEHFGLNFNHSKSICVRSDIVFKWNWETESSAWHTSQATNVKTILWFQAKLASHNFPIYCGVVTSINADNNILRG